MAKTPSPVPDQGWAVKGYSHDHPPKLGTPNPTKYDLTIPEVGYCISMPAYNQQTAYSGPLGTPIDATLAVGYIRNFIKSFRIIRRKSKFVFEEATQDMDDAKLNDHVRLIAEEAKEFYEKSKKFYENVVKLNVGMTMDKNMALKLLSQPRCEGLRFYLCSKGKDNVSLVAVGVDCEGVDLNYKYPPSATENDTANPVVGTQSLVGDYVTPPYQLQFEDFSPQKNDIPDCFVLLKTAAS
jgi:hypothetical protein